MVRVVRGLSRVERVLEQVADWALAVTAVLITADVVARYAFRAPIIGVYEFTQYYLLVAMVYLALAHAESAGAHVRITMVYSRLGGRVRRSVQMAASLVTAVYFALTVWRGWDQSWHAWVTHEVATGIIGWPLYYAYLIVPLGSAVMVVRLVVDAITGKSAAQHGPEAAGQETVA